MQYVYIYINYRCLFTSMNIHQLPTFQASSRPSLPRPGHRTAPCRAPCAVWMVRSWMPQRQMMRRLGFTGVDDVMVTLGKPLENPWKMVV